MTQEEQPVRDEIGLDDFVADSDSPPLLLQRRVVAAIVVAFLALAGGYLVMAATFGWTFKIDAEPLQDWVDKWGLLGPLVFIGVMALSVLFAPIPNTPIFIAAGLAWGPVLGTTYSMAGLLLGSALAFYVARYLGRRHLSRLIGARAAERLDHLADTMGGRVIFWSRMLPAVNFDWVSFLAGMTSIRFSVFFVYSLLGMLLPTSVTVIAGDGLGKDVRITIAMIGLWVLGIVGSAVYFWLIRRRTGRGQLTTG